MIALIKHAVRTWKANRHEKEKKEKRSSQWPRVEKEHLEKHPSCAACGGKTKLQVHHEQPFHSHPELELEPTNLITLCMSRNDCHILIGHGDDFKFYNPHVKRDATECLEHPDQRNEIAARAKKNRLVNEPGGA